MFNHFMFSVYTFFSDLILIKKHLIKSMREFNLWSMFTKEILLSTRFEFVNVLLFGNNETWHHGSKIEIE